MVKVPLIASHVLNMFILLGLSVVHVGLIDIVICKEADCVGDIVG